jgi:hypothetical protein
MKIAANCPVKARAIQADAYAEAGMEEFTFPMPRPFTTEMFSAIAAELEIDPAGLTNQMNQVLAENLGNNLASRIRSVVKFNSELASAQENGEREDEEPRPLPTHDDLAALIESYDFSGARAGTGAAQSLTPVQREVSRLVKTLVRSILHDSGLASENMPAPVTIAKKGEAAEGNQVSWDDFLGMVEGVIDGEGPWGEEGTPYYTKREEILEQAEANVRATQLKATDAAATLSM